MKRFPMGWLLLITVGGVWLLSLFGVVTVIVAMVVTFIATIVGAAFLDLTTRGSAKAVRDQNAPNFYGPIGGETWQVPTAYIDHPTGTGPPPGVERYDEAELDRHLGGRTTIRPSGNDPAP